MDFLQAVRSCLKKYVTWEGRARRSEYWWFVLFLLILEVIAGGTADTSGRDALYGIYFVVEALLFLPTLSATVRRLHDTDRSGAWILIAFLPICGSFFLLFMLLQRGTDGGNRFGNDPIRVAATA
jgi:uncharacterized membrane protein YhaH (DUF805 family)